jgi:hypothetical protein
LEFLSECVNDIDDAASRAGEIIHRLKRFIKNRGPERSETEICELIDETIALLKFELAASRVTVEVESSDVAIKLRIDPIQIQQVLVNLIKNAIDSIEESQSATRRIVLRIESNADFVTIAIEDSGKGFTDCPDDIFAAFVTTKNEGLGIGLAISRTIVETHSGQLTHGTAESGGAVFSLRLPEANSHSLQS